MSIIYPYSRQEISAEDIEAVTAVLRGRFLTQGPGIEAFEAALCARFGVRFAVVCNSGTAALHLAYLAFELGPQKGLLTAPITFLATANAARMCGAPVAFADVDPVTGNLDVSAVESVLKKLNTKIGAIAPVHLGGRPCNMPEFRKIADSHGCVLIEDACHAPLAAYQDESGQRFHIGACSHSDAVVLSFHAIKHVAMGEGGAVLTNNQTAADRARIFRSHGMVRDPACWFNAPESDAPWYYEMHDVGWNYRATDFQCALGHSQLMRIESGLRRRQEIAARYDQLLRDTPYLRRPQIPPMHEGHSWHLYAVAIDFAALGRTRGQVMRALAKLGVGTQVHYIPLYHQPYYALVEKSLPGAESYYADTLSIPMYPNLADGDLIMIAQHLRAVLAV